MIEDESILSRGSTDDPRLRGFRRRSRVEEVVAWIDEQARELADETIDLAEGFSRVLAENAIATAPVPRFSRAAMDGFALRGDETRASSRRTPSLFRIVGESKPGRESDGIPPLNSGEAIRIATGAPLPRGADAVSPFEIVEVVGDLIRVFESTPPGRHVGAIGEDIQAGESVLSRGRVLRPQDLGVLSAMGSNRIRVVRKPRVAVIATGDELLPAGSPSIGAKIADANSPILVALVERDGGSATVLGPLPDDRNGLKTAIVSAAEQADLVIVAGGSSVGPEDHAPTIVAEAGRLAFHGVALRPASPTGLGTLPGQNGSTVLVALLPGNPVSCLCGYDFFAGRIVRRLAGRSADWPYHSRAVPIAVDFESTAGRIDYVRATLNLDGRVRPIERSAASILSSVTRADGFLVVPEEVDRLAAGDPVVFWFYG